MPAPTSTRDVTRYILIAIALVAVATLLWEISDALVIAFGGLVVATVLQAIATPISRRTGWSHRASVSVAVAGLVVVFGVLGALFGAQAAAQFAEFRDRLPEAVEKFQDWIQGSEMGQAASQMIQQALGEGKGVAGFGLAAGILASGVAHLVLILFLGIYFAADPPMYRNGMLRLFPPSRRSQVRSAVNDAGTALRKWLLAQLVIMALVGLLTGISLAIAGVPMAILLGVLAGLLEFVPVVGPIAAAVPGVLLAFTKSPETALVALGIYIVVQQIESNILTPVVQRWAVELPPVLALISIVVCGLLFGVLGIIFATPLAVVVVALVQHLYVEDTLENGGPRRRGPRANRG
jgi:predicted PurR-regulated permease PerM